MASLGGDGGGADRPGDTLQGVTPDLKLICLWLNLERYWINDVVRWEW